jgi:uncharacterized protein involved in response to NO
LFALDRSGFRPFFLLAGLLAIALVPSWLFMLRGWLRAIPHLPPLIWHPHEMIFGYAVAVIAGFLLTAVGNWTKRETLIGAPLIGLAALWLLGRIAMLIGGHLPRALPAVVDLAFLPLLGLALARPLLASGNRRNYVMLVIVTALFAANLVVHFDTLGVLADGYAWRACLFAVDVVLLVILVIAGRVFPMFTRNATGVESIRSHPRLDRACIGSMVVLTAVDAALPRPMLVALSAGLTALLAAGRAAHWGSQHTGHQPLLWILHTGYAWLVVGLVLRTLAALGLPVSSSLATHALTVGAIGSLTLGMMARVSLGHIGRRLTPSPAMTWAFAAINGAAVARALVPLAAPDWYNATLWAAAALWSAAFLIFIVCYAPVLTAPRIDGKPG